MRRYVQLSHPAAQYCTGKTDLNLLIFAAPENARHGGDVAVRTTPSAYDVGDMLMSSDFWMTCVNAIEQRKYQTIHV